MNGIVAEIVAILTFVVNEVELILRVVVVVRPHGGKSRVTLDELLGDERTGKGNV